MESGTRNTTDNGCETTPSDGIRTGKGEGTDLQDASSPVRLSEDDKRAMRDLTDEYFAFEAAVRT